MWRLADARVTGVGPSQDEPPERARRAAVRGSRDVRTPPRAEHRRRTILRHVSVHHRLLLQAEHLARPPTPFPVAPEGGGVIRRNVPPRRALLAAARVSRLERGTGWWKRTSPAVIAAILFGAIGRNRRRGVIANLRRIRGSQGEIADRWRALQTFVQFAYCLTETLEHASPYARPLDVDSPPEIEGSTLCRAIRASSCSRRTSAAGRSRRISCSASVAA